MVVRFIHTADWQLGLRVRYIPGDAGALVRNARLKTAATIGALAKERKADFVVVAGDVFEHHGLKADTLRKTFDIWAEYPCPIYLLPGNHDPYTPDAIYRTNLWKQEAPEQVKVLSGFHPLLLPTKEPAYLFPCPLLDRHTLEDPTEHLKADFGPQGCFRIGVAHGSIGELLRGIVDDPYALNNSLSAETAKRAGLDYLALGDWHGLLKVDERSYYSGAPEATRFKEKDPGKILMVELTKPGVVPQVEPVEVFTQRWVQHQQSIRHADDLAALEHFFDGLQQRAETLVELFIEGSLPVESDLLLRKLLERQKDRVLWLRVRDEDYRVLLDSSEIDSIAQQGWARQVVEDLRHKAEHQQEARDALRLLFQLSQEQAP